MVEYNQKYFSHLENVNLNLNYPKTVTRYDIYRFRYFNAESGAHTLIFESTNFLLSYYNFLLGKRK